MSFSDLVRPQDPLVARLLHRLPPGGAEGPAVIRVLGEQTAGWAVGLQPGPAASYGAMASAAEMNCIDYAALACAALRRAGIADAYVVMGSLAGAFPLAAHAWTVFRDPGDAGESAGLVVDVRDRHPRPVPPGWSAAIDAVAAFNEATAALGRGPAGALAEIFERKVTHT